MLKIVGYLAVVAAFALLPPPVIAQEVAPSPGAEQADAATSASLPPDVNAMILANLPPDAQSAVSGINAFSVDLYKRTLVPDKNLFLSPASVSTAMALVYRGAVGTTGDKLRNVMHYNAAPNAYFRASAPIFASMNFSGNGRMLQTANSIWIQQGMQLKPDYLADVQSFMKAGLWQTDFQHDHEKSRQDINAWVASSTHDRIVDILEPGDLTELTSAVLVNAIYWKARWLQTFAKDETEPGRFTRLNRSKVTTPLMHLRTYFSVVERGGVKAIDLPYVGNEASLVVFLPNSSNGLKKFEQKVTAEELDTWFSALNAAEPRDTVLTLPKMHLEWRKDLVDTLAAMGAETGISGDADFSGIATFPNPGGDPRARGLAIKQIIHKSWLDVDEEGAEAAAATAVVMDIVTTGRRKNQPPPPPPIIFRADKPFLLVLRDRRTGLILFMGRYVGPAE
ncbi:MAG: serpin family protein [Sphingomonas bacterium]